MILFTLIFLLLIYSLFFYNSRSALDVHLDLLDFDEKYQHEVKVKSKKKEIFISLGLILSVVIGFYTNAVAGAVCFFLIIITRKIITNRKSKQRKMLINRILPLTMERLVMTIEAGNDVISACRIIIEQDRKSGLKSNLIISKYLESVVCLTKNGQSFTESLKQVSKQVTGTALSQTFVHLSLAYQQGGELIGPLRELSGATQLAYQETVEEEIAKLPVKATLPLVLVFSGLILFFITPPLLEVQKLTTTVQDGS